MEKEISNITIRLPKTLLEQLKKEAQNLGISFNAYIIYCLTNRHNLTQ